MQCELMYLKKYFEIVYNYIILSSFSRVFIESLNYIFNGHCKDNVTELWKTGTF